MNISPVNARLIKASSPAFAASLARKPGVNNYLDALDFRERRQAEDALYLFAKNLAKRPEKTVLEIDSIDSEKAKRVVIKQNPGEIQGTEYDEETQQYVPYFPYPGAQKGVVSEPENIKLSANGKSSGFYMNLDRTPEELAEWLENTYNYITGQSKK